MLNFAFKMRKMAFTPLSQPHPAMSMAYVLLDDTIEQIDEAAVEQLLTQLPDWRREQAMRFKHLAGKRECAASYLLLCKALREKHGITQPPHFVIGSHGKPSLLEHPHLHFNLSHCRSAVLCAVSQHAIGVDVERCRPFKEALVRHTMNDEELAQIMQGQDPSMEFTKLWTAKEAVVKLTGKGLTHDITDILVQARHEDIHIDTVCLPHLSLAYSIAYHQES